MSSPRDPLCAALLFALGFACRREPHGGQDEGSAESEGTDSGEASDSSEAADSGVPTDLPQGTQCEPSCAQFPPPLECDLPLPPAADPCYEPGAADPEDSEPPTLSSAEALDSHTIRLQFSEPIGSLEGVDPSSFAIGTVWSEEYYGYRTFYDRIGPATVLRHECGAPDTLILELAGSAEWQCADLPTYDHDGYDHPSIDPPVLGVHHSPIPNGADGPVTDRSGNPLAGFGSWFVDDACSLSSADGIQACADDPITFECPTIDREFGVTGIEFLDDTTLRVSFTEPVTGVDTVDPAQFRISFQRPCGGHCGVWYLDPGGEADPLVVADVAPDAADDAVLLTTSKSMPETFAADCMEDAGLTGFFLHYAAVSSPCHGDLLDADGNALAGFGEWWVIEHGYTDLATPLAPLLDDAHRLPFQCP